MGKETLEELQKTGVLQLDDYRFKVAQRASNRSSFMWHIEVTAFTTYGYNFRCLDIEARGRAGKWFNVMAKIGGGPRSAEQARS